MPFNKVTNKLECSYGIRCRNCSWIQQDAESQKALKMDQVLALFPSLKEISYLVPSQDHFRSHLDLRIEDGTLGFPGEHQKVFKLDSCEVATPGLEKALQKLQEFSFPIKKGSLRLRQSPSGMTGVWLDFSHEDAHQLFQEKSLLQSLSENFHVEIGQKRKPLTFQNGEPKLLKEWAFLPWAQTFHDEQAIPLLGTIAAFTQTGLPAQKVIARELQRILDSLGARRVLEFGSGLGTLTFPAAGSSREVIAFENDLYALKALETTLKTQGQFKDRIRSLSGDFQRSPQITEKDYETVIVNPPRSGLMKLAEVLPTGKNLIYMSCFLESFARDYEVLKTKNYRVREIVVIDQFPHTPHLEILATLTH
ncbi:MAG: methyltransferase [Proteobacteria bacterium]|jgi:23S rRNA (uracil1939-C5)-methyltransferase|nr:methyltransferase [Pseudomonadota bacterium]